MINIVSIDPTADGVAQLLALSDAYMGALYPAESNHLEGAAALAQPNVHLLGAYDGTRLVATGAVKLMEDDGRYGEVKRVFILDDYRGQGLSKRLMERLEAHLLASGVPRARLETGNKQPEALGLYRKLGYVERTPFGSYQPDPLSIFMEKRLGA